MNRGKSLSIFHKATGVMRALLPLLRETVRGWNDHNDLRLGASLAYYTVFSLAPLFLIALAIAGYWFGEDAASRQLYGQIASLVGSEGGEAIQAMVASAYKPGGGILAGGVAFFTLLVGATGVFIELQSSLNTIWEVRRKPGNSIRRFVKARMLSFAMVLAIGFLLLVSLIISAVLAAVGKYLSGVIPAEELFWQLVNFLVSYAIITLLYAFVFKWLPDVRISWGDAFQGAMISALLFNLGKFALGYYLGRSTIASIYGAAGSFLVILVWVYYSSQTLFLGAEFARAKAHLAGKRPEPAAGAEWIDADARLSTFI